MNTSEFCFVSALYSALNSVRALPSSRFVQERFDRLFEFDKGKRGGINKCELDTFIDSNNKPPNALGK